jgi:hypothetical protein
LLASLLLLLLPGRLRLVFLLALIPGLLSLLLIVFRVHERRPGSIVNGATPGAAREQDIGAAPGAGLRVAGGGVLERVRAAARGPMGAFLLVLVVFTLGNATDAFLLLRAQDLGVPLALIPLLWGAHHVSKMVWNVPGGMLADRFGPRHAIIAGWLIYALTYAAFAYASVAWHAWALFLVYGLFYGLTEAPEKALIAQLAPAARRGAALAYHFAIGIAALPASLIFGVIWSAYSTRGVAARRQPGVAGGAAPVVLVRAGAETARDRPDAGKSAAAETARDCNGRRIRRVRIGGRAAQRSVHRGHTDGTS